MKNHKLLFFAFIATVFLSACGKDDDTQKNTNSDAETGLEIGAGGKTYLISKIKESDTDYITLDYDDDGRLTKYSEFNNGEMQDYATINYAGNTVTITENYDEEGKFTTVATLGANGYASKTVATETYTEGGDTYSYESVTNYTYNTDGYLTKIVYSDKETSDNPDFEDETSSGITEFTYSNGNLVKSVETYDGDASYTVEYEYYTDKAYNPVADLGEFKFLLGKTSKNLVKKEIWTDAYDDQSNSGETNYTFTFNEDGLPITVNRNMNNEISIEYIVK